MTTEFAGPVSEVNLRSYDLITVSTSGGKDSQAMLDVVSTLAREQGVVDRLHLIHADLGLMEWPGTTELVRKHADAYELPLHVVERHQGDLLEHARQMGYWPKAATRWCTSDHKRDQIVKVQRRLARETGANPVRVLTCVGLRAQESPGRARRTELGPDRRLSLDSGRRVADMWLPIHGWTTEQVWECIRSSGVPHHYAYDLGMGRLSCALCIFAPRLALLLAGYHNRELLDRYVAVEQEIGHRFQARLSLESVRDELKAGWTPPDRPSRLSALDWRM